jgi:hypothetical protein
MKRIPTEHQPGHMKPARLQGRQNSVEAKELIEVLSAMPTDLNRPKLFRKRE